MNRRCIIVTGAFGYIGSTVLDALITKFDNSLFIGVVKNSNDLRKTSRSQVINYVTPRELIKLDFSNTDRVDLVHCANSVSPEHTLALAVQENFIFWYNIFIELSSKLNSLKLHLIESYWQYNSSNSYRYTKPYDISKSLLSESLTSEVNKFEGVKKYVLYDVYDRRDPRGKLLNILANGYSGILELKSACNKKTFVKWSECLDMLSDLVENPTPNKVDKYYFTHGNARPLVEIVTDIINYYELPIKLSGTTTINYNEPVEIVNIENNPLKFTDNIIKDFIQFR
jgi:nucleoside-diphosphate-sugar epimerase